jgi:hypothetical protein
MLVDPQCLLAILKEQRNGSAAGPSGWSGDILALLAKDEACVQKLAILTQDIINGLVPQSARDMLLSAKLIGIPKDNPDELRPIAMAEPFLKLAISYAASRTNNAIATVLGKTQLGVGVPGGCERAIQRVQCLLEAGTQDTIALLVDFKNAFNNARRDVFLNELFRHESLRPLWSIAHFAYSSESELLLFDQGRQVARIASATGTRQGCKIGSHLFALAVRAFYERALQQCPDVTGVAICDDLTLVGPAASVFRVYDWILANSQPLTGLSVQVAKTKVLYAPPAATPTPAEIFIAASARHLTIVRGATKLLGSVIGLDDNARRAFVDSKIDAMAPTIQRLLTPGLTYQAAMLLLRSSINVSPMYLFRTLPPDITRAAARRFHKMVLEAMCRILDLPALASLPDSVRLSIELATQHGGLGITDPEPTLEAGYLSAVANSVQDNFCAEPRRHLLLPDQQGRHIATATHVQHCLEQLAAQGVDPRHACLPDSVSGMVQRFAAGPPKKMQHLLLKSVQKYNLQVVLGLCQHDDRWAARLRSASGPGAHHWLTTLPTDKSTTMLNDHYRIAAKYLLGVDPWPRPPPCCYCRRPMANDPWHPIHCRFQNSHGKSLQHNQIRDLLHEYCKLAGLGATTIEATQYQASAHAKPDLVVPFPANVTTVDVSGTDPTAPSYVAAAARSSLHAARRRETEKNNHYAELVRLYQLPLVPFVFETHGALGPRAMNFIDELSQHAQGRPGSEVSGAFRFQLLSRISVIVQTANAQLMRDAYTDSRMAAHRVWIPVGSPPTVGGQGRQGRR